jgi:hypothetical protein
MSKRKSIASENKPQSQDPTPVPSTDGQPQASDPSANGQPQVPDPFDPESLRLDPGNAEVGVQKVLLRIPVRRPDKSWFVRAHPDPAYRLQTYLIELKEERELYLVAPDLRPALATEPTCKPKLLVTSVNRQGVLFLWELNLPRSDGRKDEWARTALEAVERAEKAWVRVSANMSLGAYDLAEAPAALGNPVWPQLSLRELLRIAFKDRFIDTPGHSVLRRLRGEV